MQGMSSPLERDLRRVGGYAAALAACLTALWVIALVAVPGPPADATALARLTYLADHPETAIAPALVVGLALLFIPIWLGLAAAVWSRRPAAGVLAVTFGLVYAPLASINYWSQLTVVRGLASLSRTDPAGSTGLYRLFEFPAGLTSLAYGLDVFAYAVWGIAAIAIAVGLWALAQPVARAAALAFGIGGSLAIVGCVGFVIGIPLLELGVMLSGIAALVAMVLAAVWLLREPVATPADSIELSIRLGRA